MQYPAVRSLQTPMWSIYWAEAFDMAFWAARQSGYRFRVHRGYAPDGRAIWIVGRYRRQQWRSAS